jgi:hypothetical protein
VKSAALASDRRTVLLEVAGLKPVHQMRIALRAAPAGGKPASFEIHNTIHALGD